jgi:hypothetical protein
MRSSINLPSCRSNSAISVGRSSERFAGVEEQLLLLPDVGLARAVHQQVGDPVENLRERRGQPIHGEIPTLVQNPRDFAGWLALSGASEVVGVALTTIRLRTFGNFDDITEFGISKSLSLEALRQQ